MRAAVRHQDVAPHQTRRVPPHAPHSSRPFLIQTPPFAPATASESGDGDRGGSEARGASVGRGSSVGRSGGGDGGGDPAGEALKATIRQAMEAEARLKQFETECAELRKVTSGAARARSSGTHAACAKTPPALDRLPSLCHSKALHTEARSSAALTAARTTACASSSSPSSSSSSYSISSLSLCFFSSTGPQAAEGALQGAGDANAGGEQPSGKRDGRAHGRKGRSGGLAGVTSAPPKLPLLKICLQL